MKAVATQVELRPRATRVLVVGATVALARELEQALPRGEFLVLGCVGDDGDLAAHVRTLGPEAILIHADSPARDTLEHLALLNQESPKPMVMFCGQSDRQLTRDAARAGVSLYVVDGLSAQVLRSLVDAALLHFQDHQLLRTELAQARQTLADREAIAQAKCALMEREGLTEADSYHALRRLAMDRGQRLADLARALIAATAS